MRDSPPLTAEESAHYEDNHVLVASRGRGPNLKLWSRGRPLALADWAAEILDQMQGICELLDAGDDAKPFVNALALQRAKLADPSQLPSARLLDELASQGVSFFELALGMSRLHRDYFRDLYPPNEQRLAELRTEAGDSLEQQQAVEIDDKLPFRAFVDRYLAGNLV